MFTLPALNAALVMAVGCLVCLLAGTCLAADWRTECNARIEQHRKGDFAVAVVIAPPESKAGVPGSAATQPAEPSPAMPAAPGTAVVLRQVRSHFHFGTAIGGNLLLETEDQRQYRKFIVDHFNTLVCENDMKWYATEMEKDKVSYDAADLLTRWGQANGLSMRGHCLFWSRPKFTQKWVQELSDQELRQRIDGRLREIVGRYKGRLIAWDVNNEMLDGSFYRDRLGEDIRVRMFKLAHELDPATPLFVNEYGIIGSPQKTQRYLDLIKGLQARGAPVGGIGVQEHACERFAGVRVTAATNPSEDAGTAERQDRTQVSSGEIHRTLDKLAATGLPIHLTEISCKTPDHKARADGLEVLVRTGFAHPKVEAILVWGFWERRHWLGADAALVDRNWKLTPAGERLQQMLLKEWRTLAEGKLDDRATLRFRGFYGSYEVLLTGPDGRTRRGKVDLTPANPTGVVTVR